MLRNPVLLFVALTTAITAVSAQTKDEYVVPEMLYEDYVYKPDIHSVTLSSDNTGLTFPVINLAQRSPLVLGFDDFAGNNGSYYYKVIHCTADWQPDKDILEMDFIDGYSSDRITASANASGTLADYIHYSLQLPNENTRLKISGNYLLLVYHNDDEHDVVITRRFMVLNPVVSAQAVVRRVNDVSKLNTWHALNFSINHEHFAISNPTEEIKTVVLQNGRWDTAVPGGEMTGEMGQVIQYFHPDQVTFPAGKDFRRLDVRNLSASNPLFRQIVPSGHDYRIVLEKDLPRKNLPNFTTIDANGRFVIASSDNNRNPDNEVDYAYLTFTLKMDKLEKTDVYVMGGFSGWRPLPDYKMNYVETLSAYQAMVPIKQGYYDYCYGVLRKGEKILDPAPIEGNDFECRNQYTILVYYRPFGGRYDQLICIYYAE